MSKKKNKTTEKKLRYKKFGDYIYKQLLSGSMSRGDILTRGIEYGDSIISNARSLQSIARELQKTTQVERETFEVEGETFEVAVKIDEQNRDLFLGKCIAAPVLFALAAELALKALYCQEAKKHEIALTHDLERLFEELGEDTQVELEATFKESMFPKLPPKMQDILGKNKDVFLDWRYSFEHLGLCCYTGELDEAISAIIKTYYKMVRKERHYKKQLLRDSARARDLSK